MTLTHSGKQRFITLPLGRMKIDVGHENVGSARSVDRNSKIVQVIVIIIARACD